MIVPLSWLASLAGIPVSAAAQTSAGSGTAPQAWPSAELWEYEDKRWTRLGPGR